MENEGFEGVLGRFEAIERKTPRRKMGSEDRDGELRRGHEQQEHAARLPLRSRKCTEPWRKGLELMEINGHHMKSVGFGPQAPPLHVRG